MGWYDDGSRRETRPVGRKPANAWGLFDVHGNVGEWCNDWHDWGYPEGAVTDPLGPAGSEWRVLRGGSFAHYDRDVRSAARNKLVPYSRDHATGFRLVRAASAP